MSQGLIPSSQLACQSYEFMTLWDRDVKPGCQDILKNPDKPVKLITELYTAVYRLASNPCTKVPMLIRGSQNEQVKTRDMTAQQCLVLYYLLRELLKEHIQRIASSPEGPFQQVIRESENSECYSEANFVAVYVNEWYRLLESLRKLKAVFNYLQNHWHTLHMQNTNIFFNVMAMGMNMWNDYVVHNNRDRLKKLLIRLYLGEIAEVSRERYSSTYDEPGETHPINRALLKEMTKTLVELDQHIVTGSAYSEIFDSPLRNKIAENYRGKSPEFFSDNLYESLKKISNAICEEETRARLSTVQSTTLTKIRVVILSELLLEKERLKTFIAEAMSKWLFENHEGLKLLYTLLQHSPTEAGEFQNQFSKTLFEMGCSEQLRAVEASETPEIAMVESVVATCLKFMATLTKAFGEGTAAMWEAFEKGCANLVDKNPKWKTVKGSADEKVCPLARYVHYLVVTKNVSTTETLDPSIEMSLRLFLHLGKSDPKAPLFAFMEQYQRDLARRLLFYPRVDALLESALITRIGRAGAAGVIDYVHRFNKMKEEWEQTRKTVSNGFSVIAFAHYWPFTNERPFAPIKIKDTDQMALMKIPNVEPKHVVTMWMPGVSFATLQLNPRQFSNVNKPLDVTVSHLHASILMALQKVDVPFVSFYKTVLDLGCFGYSANDVALAGAFLAKIGLIRVGEKQEIDEDYLNNVVSQRDNSVTFSINSEFCPPFKMEQGAVDSVDFFTHAALFPRSEINVIDNPESLSAVSTTGPSDCKLNDIGRRRLISIHIVSHIKSCGSVSHDALWDHVRSKLAERQIEITKEELKREVEDLIEKEYIERDPSTFGVYRHVA